MMKQKRLPFNIIDLLVLLLLIVCIVIVAVKLHQAKTPQSAEIVTEPVSGPPAEFAPNLRFVCVAEGLERSLADRIVSESSNRIYNSYRLCDAYVTEIVIEPSYVVAAEDGQGIVVEDPLHVNLRCTVQAQLKESDGTTSISGNFNSFLGSQEVRLGKPYTLKTMTYELSTTVVELEAARHD